MSLNNLVEAIQRFPLFKVLSKKALRAADRGGQIKQISEYLQTLGTYSRTQWLRDIIQIRDKLYQFVAPRAFELHKDTFRSLEPTSRDFMEEICEFCEWNVENSWPVDDAACSVDEYQQLTIDGFDSILKLTFQRALYVGHWTHKLSSLCRTLEKLPSKMQIDIHQLQFSDKDAFASGGHGSVYKAILLHDGDGEMLQGVVAVKFMRFASKEQKPWTSLHEEALSLLNLEIPGLNSFIGVTMDPQRGLGLVSPYLQHGNAVKYLNKQNMTVAERITWVCTIFPLIVSAVHQLHYVHLAHGDIKGANILIDDDLKPCLTDFGLARVCAANEVNAQATSSGTASYDFTLRFCSPERYQSERHNTSEADDVWALGMTFVELLIGQLPFFPRMRGDPEFMCALYEGTLALERSDVPEEVDEDLWQLIQGCTEIDPQVRWSSYRVYSAMETIRGRHAIEKGDMPVAY